MATEVADAIDHAKLIADRAFSARAVTGVSRFRFPGWNHWVRFLFWLGPRYAPFLVAPLTKLQFIHVGRWSVVDELPSAKHPGQRERIKPGAMIFETNYDGPWRPYIEAFSRVMPVQWMGIWTGTKGFPGPIPASGLLAHIDDVDVRPTWYYSAHRDTSLKVIVASLELEDRVRAFAERARDLDDDQFATAYAEFLAEVQWLM